MSTLLVTGRTHDLDVKSPVAFQFSTKFEFAGQQYDLVPRDVWRQLQQQHQNSIRRAGTIKINNETHILLEVVGDREKITDKNLSEILTARELQIAHFVAQGKCDKLTARELGISENTVREHLRRIFHKLQITKRTSLVFLLMKSKVIFS
jgi:DNA-binding NarL/FixJ family response regulator